MNAGLLWLALSSVLCVAGQTAAKVGLDRLALGAAPRTADLLRMATSPLVWVGGVLLVVGTAIWFHALSRLELSVALPLSALLTLMLSVAAGRLCFGEVLPATRVAGLLLALVAAALIARR